MIDRAHVTSIHSALLHVLCTFPFSCAAKARVRGASSLTHIHTYTHTGALSIFLIINCLSRAHPPHTIPPTAFIVRGRAICSSINASRTDFLDSLSSDEKEKDLSSIHPSRVRTRDWCCEWKMELTFYRYARERIDIDSSLVRARAR